MRCTVRYQVKITYPFIIDAEWVVLKDKLNYESTFVLRFLDW